MLDNLKNSIKYELNAYVLYYINIKKSDNKSIANEIVIKII